MAQAILQLPRLRLRGLMSIPAPTSDITQQRRQFRMVREALESLRQKLQEATDMDTLTLGMSGDYAAAIAEGATIVRIGSAMFGVRPAGTRDPT